MQESAQKMETPTDSQKPVYRNSNGSEVTAPSQPQIMDIDVSPSGDPKYNKSTGALLASFAACLEAAALGAVIGYASPAIPDINGQPPGAAAFRLDTVEDISWMASTIALGGMVSGVFSGPLLDRFGRKLVIIGNNVPFVVGWLLVAAADSLPLLYIGRFLTGFCGGVIDVAVPVYLMEVSPATIRGFLGSCHELFVNLGILFAFAGGCFLHFRWLAISCANLAVVGMILMCFMPETPRWLMATGLRKGAIQSLEFLRGNDNGAEINRELEEIVDNIKASSGEITWRDFLQPTFYKPLYIVATVMFVNQFSGYSVVYEYTVSIFSSAGITSLSPNVQTSIVGVAGVVSNAVSAVLVDRLGRRPMLLLSAVIMAISMGGMGAFFLVKEKVVDLQVVHGISWLPIVSLVGYNFGLNIGFGPIPFYLAGELFPLKTRGVTCGICIIIWSIFLFLVSHFFMDVIAAVHDSGAYWILAGVSALSIVFVLLAVPETKGKTLEEIESDFRK